MDYPACYTVDTETVVGLRQLRARGWQIGVITNGGPAQLAKLEATNLIEEFDAICVSEVVGAAKPDPVIFEMAAELCEIPLEGWMTGDSAAADMAGGRGVGLRTIWIARGHTWASPDPAPDAVVSTVPQAIKSFSNLTRDDAPFRRLGDLLFAAGKPDANFGKRAIATQRYSQRQGDVALATHAHRPLSRPCEVGLREESGRPEPGKAD